MARKPPKKGWQKWIQPETYDFEPKTPALKLARKATVTVVGFSVVLIGIVMIATPGPAIIVIPAGLGILALEFAWARRGLRRIKAYTKTFSKKVKRHRESKKTAQQ